MNDYEARREERIERYRQRAAAARIRSTGRLSAAHGIADRIPLGQPIIVGHHSERGHRADLKRIHGHYQAAYEEDSRAKYWEQRAEAAESNSAISANDPDAIEKLREKLAAAEAHHARRVEQNKRLRKARITPDHPQLREELASKSLGLTDNEANSLYLFAINFAYQCRPYVKWPPYDLANSKGRINQVKERIAQLERRASTPARPEAEGNGIRLVHNPQRNSIELYFPTKPAQEVRDELKRCGFRWGRTSGCWYAKDWLGPRALAERLMKPEAVESA